MNQKVTMNDIKFIARELAKGTGVREISRRLNLSRPAVTAYKTRGETSGHTWKEIAAMDDKSLADLMTREPGHRTEDEERRSYLTPRLPEYAKDMGKKYMTFEKVYARYTLGTGKPYGYTQFKKLLKQYIKNHDYKFHNTYEPGEMGLFDPAGDKVYYYDAEALRNIAVFVMVCILPCTDIVYAVPMRDQSTEEIFRAVAEFLEFIGGVPKLMKSDNMSSFVKRYDRYSPEFTDAAYQFGFHYNVDIDDTRIHKPRDKGPVESAVNQTYQKSYLKLLYDENNNPKTYRSFNEIVEAFKQLNKEFNGMTVAGHEKSRWEEFLETEKDALQPLPSTKFSMKRRKQFVVASNYHVEIGRGYSYSIPYTLIGKQAEAVWDREKVWIYVDHEPVAEHRRLEKRGYSTKEEHMPQNHREYLRTKRANAAYYLEKAALVGPGTREVVDTVLKSATFVSQSYKRCSGILRLAAKYTAPRIEKAIVMLGGAAGMGSEAYDRLSDFLKCNLDLRPTESETVSSVPDNDDVRGEEAYRKRIEAIRGKTENDGQSDSEKEASK